MQKNSIRMTLKKFFPKIDCFSMPRPLDENLPIDSVTDLSQLKPEFLEVANSLIAKKLRTHPKVKSINNRPLTGYMFLGLALEYVECFNSKITPVVMQSFERVVSIESERFVETLYDKTLSKINSRFDFS